VDPELEATVQEALNSVQEDVDVAQVEGDESLAEEPKYEFDDAQAAAIAASAAQHHHHHDPEAMDLTAAAVLAGAAANPLVDPHEHNPDLDHPQHFDQDQNAGPVPATTEELAHKSGYQNVIVESALAKRLAREGGMRLATQRRPEQILNLNRRSNVEALFAHIAGETAPVPCKNCHKGHGPWTTCVVVDGQMCGSCANCWFNASGARCSFHGMSLCSPHAQRKLSSNNDTFQKHAIPKLMVEHLFSVRTALLPCRQSLKRPSASSTMSRRRLQLIPLSATTLNAPWRMFEPPTARRARCY
jgi:hypothetical protein